MASIESAKSLSALSSAVMSVIDLTAASSSDCLNAIAAAYESDDPLYIIVKIEIIISSRTISTHNNE